MSFNVEVGSPSIPEGPENPPLNLDDPLEENSMPPLDSFTEPEPPANPPLNLEDPLEENSMPPLESFTEPEENSMPPLESFTEPGPAELKKQFKPSSAFEPSLDDLDVPSLLDDLDVPSIDVSLPPLEIPPKKKSSKIRKTADTNEDPLPPKKKSNKQL